jgi:fructokinase
MTDESYAPFRVAGLGEVLWDCFPDARKPGGANSNVAFHATQLGCEGFVISRVGDDSDGRGIVEFLQRQGLSTTAVQTDFEKPTGTVTVDVSDSGHPSFIIHEDVAWDRLEFDRTLAKLAGTLDAVCFGSLAQRSPASREAILQCLYETREDCLIVFDVNIRQQFYDRIGIERSLQAADILKLNLDEVALLNSLLELGVDADSDSAEHQFAARVREQFEVELVCITRAEEGCFVADADGVMELPGIEVEVADAVGAGDAFTAALIFSQLEGWPLESAAGFANHVGALVASHPGAMPVLKNEFQELKSEYSQAE